MNGRKDGWKDGWMKGWVDGWKKRGMDEHEARAKNEKDILINKE